MRTLYIPSNTATFQTIFVLYPIIKSSTFSNKKTRNPGLLIHQKQRIWQASERPNLSLDVTPRHSISASQFLRPVQQMLEKMRDLKLKKKNIYGILGCKGGFQKKKCFSKKIWFPETMRDQLQVNEFDTSIRSLWWVGMGHRKQLDLQNLETQSYPLQNLGLTKCSLDILSGWLFQPTHLKHMRTSNWIISPGFGVKIKHI